MNHGAKWNGLKALFKLAGDVMTESVCAATLEAQNKNRNVAGRKFFMVTF
jgi:hypothetical protein